jgi:hypothetical protein
VFDPTVWSFAVVALIVGIVSTAYFLITAASPKSDRPLPEGVSDIRPIQLMTMPDPDLSDRYLVSQLSGPNATPRLIGSFTKAELTDLEVGIPLN